MKKVLPLFFLILLGSGCNALDTMSEGYKHSQAVADDLEKSIGAKPAVGFNWHNGTLTTVSITFEGIPSAKTTEEIAVMSRNAIRAKFKQKPENIVISYALPGE